MPTNPDSIGGSNKPASLAAALSFVFLAGIAAFVVLDILVQILLSVGVVPDVRDRGIRFSGFMILLTGLSMVVGYGFFLVGGNAMGLTFSRLIRWAVYPVAVGIPLLFYALVWAAFIHAQP